jgi:hypothetical protein
MHSENAILHASRELGALLCVFSAYIVPVSTHHCVYIHAIIYDVTNMKINSRREYIHDCEFTA